jgi:hypothetical protein
MPTERLPMCHITPNLYHPARRACMGMYFTEASTNATCASGGAGDITDRHSQEVAAAKTC